MENELHIVLTCPAAKRVWELVPVMFKPDYNSIETINQFLSAARKQINLPPTGLLATPLFPWVVWNLWKARNQLVVENRGLPPERLVLLAIKEAKAWQDAQLPSKTSSRTSLTVIPNLLPQQAVHCFIDASWMASTLHCGLGWCFKDSKMQVIKQEALNCTLVPSALVAEATALKAAIIAAKNSGFRTLNCFSDSLSLVTLLNTNGVVNELKSILHDIRCLSVDFEFISFTFISRTANVLADALAKFGLSSMYSPSS